MATEPVASHNPDIAIDLHLNSAKRHVELPGGRFSNRRDENQHIALDSTIGALRELQAWTRQQAVEISTVMAATRMVDGRLRRLEAAAAADDLAIDDLRDLIEELRIGLDVVLERGDPPGP